MMLTQMLGFVAFAVGGGCLFAVIQIPLAWILGALAGASLYVNIIGKLPRIRQLRRGGQIVLGTAVAAMLTPQIVHALVGLVPFMIGATVIANLGGLAMVRPFCAIARVDRTTAILSVLPAGMAEMASLAHERDAMVGVVTITHIVRVVMIVTILPMFLTVIAATGDVQASTVAFSQTAYLTLALCLGASTGLAWVGGKAGMLNPWIVAPMIVGLVFVMLGWELAHVPQSVLIVAQIAIGASLGAQIILREFVMFPRVLLAGFLNTIGLCALMILVGATFLTVGLEVDVVTLILALSPGGLGEMVASAQAFQADIALVVGFQFVRSLITNVVAPLFVPKS